MSGSLEVESKAGIPVHRMCKGRPPEKPVREGGKANREEAAAEPEDDVSEA